MTDDKPYIEQMLDELGAFPARVKGWLLMDLTDEARADMLGTINSVASQLGELKRMHGSELEDGVTGKRYRVRVARRATRSYSNRLLNTLAIDGDVAQGIRLAIESGALKLGWNWSKLQQHMARFKADVVITSQEILPDDGDHDIGVVWADDNPRYEALHPEE